MQDSHKPLADRIRPKSLKDFVGQEHLVGKEGILRKLIQSDQLTSLILWGPPGVGKTTLAEIIANQTKSFFVSRSAVTTTLADVRKEVEEAKERLKTNERTIFFLDEIHRFNKAQQDAFLPHVENGTIILIGATTENPSFEVISPLLSRSRVLVLYPLGKKEISQIMKRGLKELELKIEKDAEDFLIEASGGDARIALNVLEIASNLFSTPPHPISRPTSHPLLLTHIETAFQKKSLIYDKAGEEHYNTISAFIKSMRASNVDAALYYLARMVEAGEDPLFIARRMVIFASEDIGVIQSTALVVANAVFQACHTIGYPECQINLAHGVAYLASAKKDRSAYEAYFKALEDVKRFGNLPIPMNLRNAPTKLMKELGYGKDYQAYTNEDLLPEKLKGKKYYK
ncbi:MAG: replication-associated recombination protein A [bacterium]|nr:replication-associated recombination protein A [bacterium]